VSLIDDMVSEAGLAIFHEALSDTVTYTPSGGVAVTVSAHVGEAQTDTSHSDDGERVRLRRNVVIGRDPTDTVNGGVADPQLEDTVTIGSDVWIVAAIIARTTNMATLQVAREISSERSREGLRSRRY